MTAISVVYPHQAGFLNVAFLPTAGAPAPLSPRAVLSSRTSSWTPPPPTAEPPGSWWRGRNTVKSSNCSSVSASQAWQPQVTGTPSS